MSFATLLRPRKQVLSDDGIEGIIDVANVSDPRKRKLEARPQEFLDLTYPTADIKRVIESLHERFSRPGDTPGLFLFEGLKGSGKSHLLLLAYHLFKNPEAAQSWLSQHDLTCVLPSDSFVILTKFTDRPLISIWDFIFEQLTGNFRGEKPLQPGLEEMQEVLGSRHLVLILDELEQGINMISEPSIRHQNIAFLQMLSEWANRSHQITLFASIYSDQDEPGSTLKRVPAVRVQFANASDRARVVAHRLFENYLSFSPESAGSVIDSYLNVWRRQLSFDADKYRSQMLQSFPFSPDLLDLILQRVPLRGGFQSVRGALGFLGNLVRLTHQTADLMTPAHASLDDREAVTRLSDLDVSRELVDRGKTNLNELREYPLASELASTVMLYTLTGTERTVGAKHEELVRSILHPGVDINDLERTLLAFRKYASYFHSSEDRYFFDLEENADAKVEFHSLRFKDAARGELRKIWRDDVFHEYNALVFEDVDETKTALETLEKDRLRYVLAPRRLNSEERHALYFGLSQRNQVILLEPRDTSSNLDTNPDLLKWAARKLAARSLNTLAGGKRQGDYDRIANEDHGEIIRALKRAGLIYVRFDVYGANPAADRVEEESMGNASTSQEVRDHLQQQLYPQQYLAEHIAAHFQQFKGRMVKDVDQIYRTELGFPVPILRPSVSKSIRELCREGKIGLRYSRGDTCGQDPNLTDSELALAVIDDPFQMTAPSQRPTSPFQPPPAITPPIQETTPTTSPAPTTPNAPSEDISVLPQTTPGALRQTIAERLQDFSDPRITEVRFTIFLDQRLGDLSTLPSALRGSLSGAGQFSAEITITRQGDFTKADVEQMAERLPSLPQAEYNARMRVRQKGGVPDA